jgi:hypothetical protein
MARGPRAALVHSGPWIGPRRWFTEGSPGWRPSAWNLAVAEEKGGGDGGDPHRLQKGATQW